MLTAKILLIAIKVLFSGTGKNSIIEFVSNINRLYIMEDQDLKGKVVAIGIYSLTLEDLV